MLINRILLALEFLPLNSPKWFSNRKTLSLDKISPTTISIQNVPLQKSKFIEHPHICTATELL